MYLGYFGLKEAPFTIAPNPAYLFMSDRHKEALAHLTYGLGDKGGFVLLTGEVGTGKTTICRTVMEQLPENTQAAFVLNPSLSCEELLATLCDELRIRYKKSGATIKYFTDKIHQQLLSNHEQGKHTLLVIDEAQHLQAEVLEQLRLLTNLETNTRKLLQVILIGQPELQQLLQRRDLRQLAQRITARYHLMPLNLQEVEQYIKHRLSVAECIRPLFDRKAIKSIHRISQGIPRVMNLLCDRALINAYNNNDTVINAVTIRRSAVDALGPEADELPIWRSRPAIISYFFVVFTFVLVFGYLIGANSEALLTIVQQAPAKTPPTNAAELGDALTSNDINSNQMKTESEVSNQEKLSSKPANEPQLDLLNEQDSVSNATAIQHSEFDLASTTQQKNTHTELLNKGSIDDSAEIELSAPVELPEETYQVLGYQPEKFQAKQQASKLIIQPTDGVSEELLARFESAIEATENDALANELSKEGPTESVFSEVTPLHEMPERFKNGLPNLEFQMHIFATDGKGWVRVNGEDRYQGEEISEGLVINDILPQQIILTFNGERFSMPALSSW